MEVDVSQIFKHWWHELSITHHPVLSLTVDFSLVSASEELGLIFYEVAGLPWGPFAAAPSPTCSCFSFHYFVAPPSPTCSCFSFHYFSNFLPVSHVPHTTEEPGTGFVLSSSFSVARREAVQYSQAGPCSSGEIESGKFVPRYLTLLEHILNWSYLGHFRAV